MQMKHKPHFLRLAMRIVVLCVTAFVASSFTTQSTSQELSKELSKTDLEEFEKSVRPLLVKHCYECHSGQDSNGGLLLDTRDSVLKGGDSGAAIVAGDPERSLLIQAVRYTNPDLQMPPKNRLTPAEVLTLEEWISSGAPDPRFANPTNTAPKPIGMSIDDGRQFWSFRPVTKPPLPDVQNPAWVQTPIDAFVLAKLEANNVHPAPQADKRTLIRRLTYDLIGLPPTPDEVNAFLADESPNAYQALVERLLSSTAYGVRWGRHWLDVARYADSNGLDENLAYGNAWRYRDYVVEAFNNDKPFDRFLVEQLAGDLLDGANQETKTATGFLMLGAKVLAEPDRDKLEMDTIDEQLDTLGKAFMGMTIGCVRCHDHKFDPIKQTDYYALAAIFKSTKTFDGTNMGAIKHWHEYSFASDEETAAIKELEKTIGEKKAAIAAVKNKAVEKITQEARAKVADYLVAAAKFNLESPLTTIEEIAEPQGLHPHILHHSRRHLANRREDPVFARWHELAEANDFDGIEMHYRALFADANAALETARKADPKTNTLDDPRLEAARAALFDTSGLLAVPVKPEMALDATTLAEYNRLSEESRVFESNAADARSAMGVSENKVIAELPIHIRGSHRNLGQSVPRGFPTVMLASHKSVDLPAEQSGRLELAKWMASKEHPLTARVFVNRIWDWHFGSGLVLSPENFGSLGDRPSHPELLDWLADHFMNSGWSIKDLHRLILASNTYQMASSQEDDSVANRIDPEDRLRWKFRLQRLDSEQIRDAVLAVSGRLDTSLGGKSVPLRNRQFVFDHTSIDHTKYESLRRAIYLPVIRNNLYSLFEQFDFPDPTTPTGHRNSTTVAPQALLMMNSELLMDSADAMAKRLNDHSMDSAARIQLAYQLAVGREPTQAEVHRASSFIGDANSPNVSSDSNGSQRSQRRWSLWCQSLLASNEFMYIR
jgi:Protein of unknown function (DUF1553)/Protein of unknown function (DUF1549)/Planctomycete cytochrome C